jgi:hypothetical protein
MSYTNSINKILRVEGKMYSSNQRWDYQDKMFRYGSLQLEKLPFDIS